MQTLTGPHAARPTGPTLRASALPALGASVLLLLAGCAVGPNYRRPTVPMATSFKEAAGWKQATPADAMDRGPWWEMFRDPVLNRLEQEATVANQSIVQAAANYEQARQLARADHATFFPTLSASGSGQRARSPSRSTGGSSTTANAGGGTGTGSSGTGGSSLGSTGSFSPINNSFSASLGASWAPDFWGRVRRLTESDVATAQASAGDLANARLSIEATLAQTYFQLRIADERTRLRQLAVNDYTRTLQIARNKYNAGVVARNDVISAEAQLDAARAQLIDSGIQRAQLEHAIAVLIGRAPGDFTLATEPTFDLTLPATPLTIPSQLLERRPDIATAERDVAAANARVGVQTAAYFPQITLTADGGYASSALSTLFRYPSRFWSVGANLGETLFDFGRRSAEVAAARAAYDSTVAGYRGTVLRALQQVEDNLVSVRLLEQEARVQEAAVNEAAEAARIAMNEYRAGVVDFTTVATAQVTEINNRLTALTVVQNRMISTIGMIESLGGGWHTNDLPSPKAVLSRRGS